MTEYIDIRVVPTADPDVMRLVTNLDLTPEGSPEVYDSSDQGDQGSPLAQALFGVPGLAALTLDGHMLWITRASGVEWHSLIEDVSDALRDFYL